jgi:hypothetical protein
MADGRRPNKRPLLGRNPGSDECFDTSVRQQYRQRAVTCTEQFGGMIDHLLEHEVQSQLTGDVETCRVQSQELAVLVCKPRLHAFDQTKDGLAE